MLIEQFNNQNQFYLTSELVLTFFVCLFVCFFQHETTAIINITKFQFQCHTISHLLILARLQALMNLFHISHNCKKLELQKNNCYPSWQKQRQETAMLFKKK